MEVAAKIDRALECMPAGLIAEADVLLEWVSRLDPANSDVRLHRAFLSFWKAAPEERREVAGRLRVLFASEAVRHKSDDRVQLYFGCVLAELGERALVSGLLGRRWVSEHPLLSWIRERIEQESP